MYFVNINCLIIWIVFAISHLLSASRLTQEELERIGATHETRREFVEKKLLPKLKYCGFQHSDDHFTYENETALDEFPWLVHIPYQSSYLHPSPGTEFKCAGVLLSNKFALTTSLCASDGFLSEVKIGQYHKHKNSTCQQISDLEECTDPVVTVKSLQIASIPDSEFLLIHLIPPITYSDYVRPICLSLNELHVPNPRDTVFTSGWGEENINGTTTTIKKKIANTVINDTACNEEGSIDKLCLISDHSTSHVCYGDEGGPVMYSYKYQWFLSGLVDFKDSRKRCIENDIGISKRITPKAYEGIIDYMFYLGH